MLVSVSCVTGSCVLIGFGQLQREAFYSSMYCEIPLDIGYSITHSRLAADSVVYLSNLLAGRLELIGSSFPKYNSSKTSCQLL